jgi:hypothetical protein
MAALTINIYLFGQYIWTIDRREENLLKQSLACRMSVKRSYVAPRKPGRRGERNGGIYGIINSGWWHEGK